MTIKKRSYALSANFAPGHRVFIYGFGAGLFIKIGISHDWAKRLREIQSHMPFPVRKILVRTVRHEVAAEAEYLAHISLEKSHHHGEWFFCAKKDAARAVALGIKEAEKKWKPGPNSHLFLAAAQEAYDENDKFEQAFLKTVPKKNRSAIAVQTGRDTPLGRRKAG